MLPLSTRLAIENDTPAWPLKVLSLEEVLSSHHPLDRVCLLLPRDGHEVDFESLRKVGLAAVMVAEDAHQGAAVTGMPTLHSPARDDVIAHGDVIRVTPNGLARVLYRRSANANFLFATARCNSLCLMCSQPPRDEDDSWRVGELLETINLIDPELDFLGITGGEPTLLGDGLAQLILRAADKLPNTRLHILTNGRSFADPDWVEMVAPALGRATFAIPLYSDIPARHDHIVQVQGAYAETLRGILNLAAKGHQIEIRHVIHALTLPRLNQFVEFLSRTLPFAAHVALMGMEPMGYAVGNRELLWADPMDYGEALGHAAQYLSGMGLSVSIYNVPLCVLPKDTWHLARKSISDWKQTYAAECAGCVVRDECSGFFKSAGGDWQGKGIKAIRKGEAHD